ncbi:MAG: hypothetical protein IPL49_08725 [Saprospirales bacterium]|nr:hypothetical protein [Saprospirales bacterium]
MKKLILVLLVFLLGCTSEFTDDQLLGKWTAVEWMDITNDKIIDIPVDFSFDNEGRYVANNGNATEKGKYWISGDNLFTIEDGKAEKKVKIAKLQNDSLLFRMNRAGTIEEILLVKEN